MQSYEATTADTLCIKICKDVRNTALIVFGLDMIGLWFTLYYRNYAGADIAATVCILSAIYAVYIIWDQTKRAKQFENGTHPLQHP